MKLELIGHDERYTVEQSLMNLLPEEKLSYEPVLPEDESWARITMTETERRCDITVEMGYLGRTVTKTAGLDLTRQDTDFEREGRRRYEMARAIFHAVKTLTGRTPPWGMLTGVRPDKPVTWALSRGETREQAKAMMEQKYFVTPERAALSVETGAAAVEAGQRLGPRDIAVYVGIPFCPTRCAYCSFVAHSVERSFSMVEPYTEALLKELRTGGEMARRQGLRVRAFYMGGGTPTTLSARQLERILTAFEESFETQYCEEITVEAGRPDTITKEKMAVLKAHGVSRISVNPQTMEDRVLAAIGRRHTAADIERAMDTVAAFSFPHVNMDLIAGLPEDTVEGFCRSLERCLAFGTDHVTVHTLALKKGSRILTEGLRVPPMEAVGQMLDYAAPALRGRGFAPYYLYRQKYMSGSFENIGWCRPAGECLYNIYIMSELCSILSFGAGGSTKMVEFGTNHIQRTFNLKYPKEYMERPEKWQANQETFERFYAQP